MSINPEACLPPGFRFHPTDEELIVHYLRNRGTSVPCPASIIVEVDIYKFNPWELPEKALFGEREWYFFSPRDRKYPNGSRPNRAAGSGYWKATGTDKPIFMAGRNVSIGVKKALVFYKGRPPKGEKTNWIMHEYRLSEALTVSVTSSRTIKFNDSSMRLEDWVLCRIYKKHNHLPHITVCEQKEKASSSEESALQGYSNEINQSALRIHKSPSVSELLDKADNYMLSHLLSEDINDNNTAASTTTSKIEQVMNYASYNNKKNVLSLDDQDFSQTGVTFSVMENPIKRQRIMENFLGNLKSSKELYSSTNLTTFIDQINTSRYNSLYPRHSNPHSELSSNFQFH